jgi:hypothetical protein
MQDKIVIVYHPTEKSSWNDRCLFLDDKYITRKAYNHRSILQNEIVIEFDDGTPEQNRKHADTVASRLKKDNISVAKWRSGNKSTHVHFFVDLKEARNVSLLKRVIMRHYTEGLPEPDYKVACDNHLIRAEFGIHEKTGLKKTPISIDSTYPRISQLNDTIWSKYASEQRAYIKRRTKTDITKLDQHPIVNKMLDTVDYKDTVGDGRERVMFALIHILKPKFKKLENGRDELERYIKEWYKYAGGKQMRPDQIAAKIVYHWNREYHITENFLFQLCEEIGIKVNVPHLNKVGKTIDESRGDTNEKA